MEIKNDEFQVLRQRVDQISSELEKQNAVRAVNTKWLTFIGAVILAALGFTSFVQLPREAAKAAKKEIRPEVIEKADSIVAELERTAAHAVEKAQSFVKWFDRMQGRKAQVINVNDGQVVVPPDNTEKRDWVAFISPCDMGRIWSGLDETDSGWVVRAKYRIKPDDVKYHTLKTAPEWAWAVADNPEWKQVWTPAEANVLLIPSLSLPSSYQADSADAEGRAAD